MAQHSNTPSSKWAISVMAFISKDMKMKNPLMPGPSGALMGFKLMNLTNHEERIFVFTGAGLGRDFGISDLHEQLKYLPSISISPKKWITFETEQPYTFEDFTGPARMGHISVGFLGPGYSLAAFITFSGIDVKQTWIEGADEIDISGFNVVSTATGLGYYPLGLVTSIIPQSKEAGNEPTLDIELNIQTPPWEDLPQSRLESYNSEDHNRQNVSVVNDGGQEDHFQGDSDRIDDNKGSQKISRDRANPASNTLENHDHALDSDANGIYNPLLKLWTTIQDSTGSSRNTLIQSQDNSESLLIVLREALEKCFGWNNPEIENSLFDVLKEALDKSAELNYETIGEENVFANAFDHENNYDPLDDFEVLDWILVPQLKDQNRGDDLLINSSNIAPFDKPTDSGAQSNNIDIDDPFIKHFDSGSADDPFLNQLSDNDDDGLFTNPSAQDSGDNGIIMQPGHDNLFNRDDHGDDYFNVNDDDDDDDDDLLPPPGN